MVFVSIAIVQRGLSTVVGSVNVLPWLLEHKFQELFVAVLSCNVKQGVPLLIRDVAKLLPQLNEALVLATLNTAAAPELYVNGFRLGVQPSKWRRSLLD